MIVEMIPPTPCATVGSPVRERWPAAKKNRKIHCVCRIGRCNFYEPLRNASQALVTLESDELVPLLAMLKLV
jgi:hypothetical protein